MGTTRDLFLLIIALFSSILFLQLSSLPDPSFYDYLRESGLPAGIVPKGVTNFSIDIKTGRFIVTLPVPCDAKFENQFHFDYNISGVLSDGRIGNLSGVTQKELFLWFAVKGIHVDPESSGLIHFDVGVADKQLSLSLFESPRDCIAAESQPHTVDLSRPRDLKWLWKKHKNSLLEALEKIKAELMILGFISLLLTFRETYILKITSFLLIIQELGSPMRLLL